MSTTETTQSPATRWRKKAVVVEAAQLSHESGPRIWEWADSKPTYGTDGFVDGLAIYTLEGRMRAEFGDWIIKGVKGEFYPCREDIFAATYEPAGAESPVAAALDRAEAAEAKLAAIGTYVEEHKGDAGFSWLHAQDILAIIGSKEEARPRITVDLNVRVRKHETYSAFEDVAGADPAGLRWGDRVLVVEVESQICSDAIVTGVDPERQLVYLAPDWHAWRDDPAKTGSDEEDTPDG